MIIEIQLHRQTIDHNYNQKKNHNPKTEKLKNNAETDLKTPKTVQTIVKNSSPQKEKNVETGQKTNLRPRKRLENHRMTTLK